MPTRRDNDEERFARIAGLMEEYRVKHEDLEAYIRSVKSRAKERRAVQRNYSVVTDSSDREPR